jgi:hypothetical protein
MPKTGTSSLRVALRRLGIRCLQDGPGTRRCIEDNIRNHRKALTPLADKFQAFTDSPIWLPDVFCRLDREYPGSKFVYTIRDTRDWVVSYMLRFGADPDVCMKAYQQHHRAVLHHFQGRPQDLLVYRLCDREGWQPLCQFLGRPIPRKRFPHINKRQPWRVRFCAQRYGWNVQVVRRQVAQFLRRSRVEERVQAAGEGDPALRRSRWQSTIDHAR